jgi:hypothetical protein
MKTIIQFLKSEVGDFSDDSEKVNLAGVEIENLRNLFLSRSKSANQTSRLKIKPQIQRNQIWTVKNEYDDFQCVCQKTSHPLLVLINTEPDVIEGEDFTRVLIVSPFIEMATERDEVCEDPSIIGFPFLVESWNDQPILTEILDEYVGYYELELISFAKSEAFELVNEPDSEYLKASSETLSDIQQEFRNIEISRAKYLNHSVLSLLSFLENRQSQA